MHGHITYEQPIHESIRIYLRLERLHQQFQTYNHCNRASDSRVALEALLKIIDIADRPDLKPKLIQHLQQTINRLTKMAAHPQIDLKRLNSIKSDIQTQLYLLNQAGTTRLAETVKEHPFLKAMRHMVNSPQGLCEVNVPALRHWLALPSGQQHLSLLHWYRPLENLYKSIALFLELTRQSATPLSITAQHFYQQSLHTQNTYTLIQIYIPNSYPIYPEISLSKHRLAIRFHPDTCPLQRTTNVPTTVQFLLGMCQL